MPQDNNVFLRIESLDELRAASPANLSVSDRVLDPMVLVDKADGQFVARLCGIKKSRLGNAILPAQSNRHNWVLDGETVRPLPRDTAVQFRAIVDGFNPESLTYAQALTLLRTPHPVITVDATAAFFEVGRVSSSHHDGRLQVPSLNATLFPYQARGVQWMRDTIQRAGGLILADEMGLGKTLQVIALLLVFKELTTGPALILCPTSLIANWCREFERFAPSLRVTVHRGAGRAGVYRDLEGPRVVISTYDTAVNDGALLNSIEWEWLVCDEAQAIKNPSSMRRSTLATFPRIRAICMTGTPVENSLLDLWSLADFTVPGVLGSRSDFEREFPDSEDSAQAVSKFTDPIILRRKVEDVAGDLPARTTIDVPLELDDKLIALYQEVRANTLRQYPKAGALVATLQLQLVCAHPWLRLARDEAEAEDAEVDASASIPLLTPKMEHALSLLQEAFANRRKVIIFATFNNVAGLIYRGLSNRRGLFWSVINGSTPQPDRQTIIDSFSAHDGPSCLVLNPRAAGAGLNITAATVVIHFSPVWNPALEAQASARAHRRGQTQPVTVYRLFYKDTVEEVMLERANWKSALANESVPISTRDASDLQRALEISPRGPA